MAPRVLIVEDDEAMAVALRDGFDYEGYEVVTARDGVSGLERAGRLAPDLIVLDVMLPKMSGLQGILTSGFVGHSRTSNCDPRKNPQ
jgi:DNA-binding response OmpR family regulator